MVTIRLAERRDAEQVRAIYNAEVDETTVTFDLVPRTLDGQVEWIDQHTGAHPAIVAVEDATGDVVGFAALSPFRDRPAYSTTVEDSVYVRRDRRGEGIGHRLLEELLRLAADHGFHSVIARIVGHHESSIRLHERCGFVLVGTEREVGRKFGKWLDVVELQRML